MPQGHIDDYICMNSEEITLSSAGWSCQPVLWPLSEVYYFIFHLDFSVEDISVCRNAFQFVTVTVSGAVCLSANGVNNGTRHSDFDRRNVLLRFIMVRPFDLHSVLCVSLLLIR